MLNPASPASSVDASTCRRPIELLAPARDVECAVAAIRQGADAVYIGAPRFGARSAAANSVDAIAELCSYAHMFGVKVYVALNTILYDGELGEARDLAFSLADAGVDALIVQDLALLRFGLPLPLHASTQMDNRTPRQVVRLGKLGFARAILARELDLNQIRSIHEATPLELEVFVHGSLCVSYSGRCYASEACFRRSANRGECAQFCRLAFDLKDADGKIVCRDRHLLSLCDMDRSGSLERLIDAGVASFKIEGRLKDAAYVKNVTAYYRRRVDEVIARRADLRRASWGESRPEFEPNLSKTFNRRYTHYFLYCRSRNLASFSTPAFVGEPVGSVTSLFRGGVVLQSSVELHNGDGLSFFGSDGRLRGFRANRVEGDAARRGATVVHAAPDEESIGYVQIGTRVFRNSDAEFMRLLARPAKERTLRLDIRMDEIPSGFRLTATDETGVTADLEFESPHQVARTPCRQRILTEMSKLGGTVFHAGTVRLTYEADWFLPAARVAEWRRALVSVLAGQHREKALEERARRYEACHGRANKHREEAESLFRGEMAADLPNVSNREAEAFYGEHGAPAVEKAYELTHNPRVPLMTCKYCLLYEMGHCKKEKTSSPRLKEPLSLVLPDGRNFTLRFDCRRCEMRLYGVSSE